MIIFPDSFIFFFGKRSVGGWTIDLFVPVFPGSVLLISVIWQGDMSLMTALLLRAPHLPYLISPLYFLPFRWKASFPSARAPIIISLKLCLNCELEVLFWIFPLFLNCAPFVWHHSTVQVNSPLSPLAFSLAKFSLHYPNVTILSLSSPSQKM